MSSVLVPIELQVLTLRPDDEPPVANGDFTAAGPGPASWTGAGEATGSAAASWLALNAAVSTPGTTTTELLPTDAAGPARLHVTATQAGGGVVQHLADPEREAAVVDVELYVISGAVVVAIDDSAGTRHEIAWRGGADGGTGQWSSVRSLAGPGGPRAIAILASPESGAGGEFWVRHADVRAFDTGNLLRNYRFTVDSPTSTTVTGSTAQQPAQASGWDVLHTGADPAASTTVTTTPDPAATAAAVLSVATTSAGCGVRQEFLTSGEVPAGVRASVRVLVSRGSIALGCGSGPQRDEAATLSADDPGVAGRWQVLSAPNATAPACVLDVYATSSGGAAFLLGEAWVQPEPWPQLLADPGFDSPHGTGPVVIGPSPNPSQDWAGGPSASTGWGVWNNSGKAVTTTELVATTRPGGNGTMMHVTTTAGGCGLVQGFLQSAGRCGPRRVTTAAWVYVLSGTVIIGTGNGGETGIDATCDTTGQWQLLRAPNGIWPANEMIIYAGGGPAEFYVDSAQVAEIEPWSAPADCAITDPSTLNYSGQIRLLPEPFADRPLGRGPGAYLKWKPPDGLSHADHSSAGSADDDAPLDFPALPDSWLVLRLSANGATTAPFRAVTGWVVSSDSSGTPFATPLDVAPSTLPTPAPVTVLGPGDPGWSAYFDSVENRFAFSDPLDGVTGPVAYLVVGWHANESADPFFKTNLDTALLAHGWVVPSGAPGEVDQALYHGSAVSIGWPARSWPGDAGGALSAETDARPDPAGLRAVLAATVGDALTELIADPDESTGQKTVLTAFLTQAVGEADDVDGPASVSAALHATGFGSAPQPPQQETIWQSGSSGDDETVGPAGDFQAVSRTRPRTFLPGEPVLLVQGAGRSFSFGGDGRFADDNEGWLACRMSTDVVQTLGPGADSAITPSGVFAAVTWPSWVPRDLPPLLTELAALDPGSAAPPGSDPAPAILRTSWWTTWKPSTAPSGLQPTGVLPAPLAITPPTRQWTAVHVDWEADWIPAGGRLSDWTLQDLDLVPPPDGVVLEAGGTQTLAGRLVVSDAPTVALAGAAEGALDRIAATGPAGPADTPGNDESATTDPGDSGDPPPVKLSQADVIGGSLANFVARLRGENTDPVIDNPSSSAVIPATTTSSPLPMSAVMASGRLQLRRARVVDGFGQVADIALTDAAGAVSSGTDLAAADADSAITLPPRLTAATQVVFQYVDTSAQPRPADDITSPVCGFLIPDFADGSLQFFETDGGVVGRLRPGPSSAGAAAAATVWEPEPGVPAAAGAQPSDDIANAILGQVADELLHADVAAALAGAPESVLSQVLRAIDTVRYTIGLLPAGDEHLALLLGHPAVVLRATLTLQVEEPDPPAELATTAVVVQLGALDRLEDGLLGYFVDDDYTRLHIQPAVANLAVPAASGAAGALRAPYFVTGPLLIHPGQMIRLTLLVEPSAQVHVTCGLVPQKAIGQRRAWIATAMHAMNPSLAYGPVLLDAGPAALPLPLDVHGTWTWLHRTDPLTWASEAPVPADAAALAVTRLSAVDGWLRVQLAPDQTWDDYGTPVLVTAVSQIDRDDPDSRVEWISGTNADGQGSWLFSAEDAIALAGTGQFLFQMQTTADGNPVCPTKNQPIGISVATDDYGVSRLTTATDADSTNHLLELPETQLPMIELWDPADPVQASSRKSWQRYTLTCAASGQLLTLDGRPATIADGAAVVQRPLASGARLPTNQQWQLIWAEKAYFQLVAWNSGMCLAAAETGGQGPADGAAVRQTTYSAAASQQWQPVWLDEHVVVFARGSSTLCLTVSDPSTDGSACVLAPYTHSPGQQWTVEAVPQTAGVLDATALECDVPATMYAWQVFDVFVTFRNTGNDAWAATAAAEIGLVALDDLSTLTWRATPLLQTTVLPGHNFTVFGSLQAGPVTATGTNAIGRFQMGSPPGVQVLGAQTFWGQASAPVSFRVEPVTAQALDATVSFDPNNLYPFRPGEVVIVANYNTVTVTVTNTGTVPLYRDLHTIQVIDPPGYHWNAEVVPVNGPGGALPILPGNSDTYTVTLRPDAASTETLQIQMTQPQVGVFGQPSAPADIQLCRMVGVSMIPGGPSVAGTTINLTQPTTQSFYPQLSRAFEAGRPNTPQWIFGDQIGNLSGAGDRPMTPNTTVQGPLVFDSSQREVGQHTLTFALGQDQFTLTVNVARANGKNGDKAVKDSNKNSKDTRDKRREPQPINLAANQTQAAGLARRFDTQAF